MPKIVCLLGSPRRQGNSATIAQCLCDKATELGASLDLFVLNELRFVGCQACMACKTGLEHCAVEDDLTPVLEAVATAVGVVLASPVYFSDVSAQAKALIDRCYSFLKPGFVSLARPGRLVPGKKAVMILTQGYADPELCADVFPRYEKHLRHLGFDQTHLIRACGVYGLGAAAADEELMRKAEDAARWLLV